MAAKMLIKLNILSLNSGGSKRYYTFYNCLRHDEMILVCSNITNKTLCLSDIIVLFPKKSTCREQRIKHFTDKKMEENSCITAFTFSLFFFS